MPDKTDALDEFSSFGRWLGGKAGLLRHCNFPPEPPEWAGNLANQLKTVDSYRSMELDLGFLHRSLCNDAKSTTASK